MEGEKSEYLKAIKEKQNKLIEQIYKERKKYSEKIISLFRCYIIRKLIRTNRICFFIKSGINVNQIKAKLQLKMSVLPKEKISNKPNKKVEYNLIYDVIFKAYILFLSRAKVKNCKYKLEFFKDNEPIVDPSFDTGVENGNYFNIIDFQKVRQEEADLIMKNEEIKKNAIKYLKDKNLLEMFYGNFKRYYSNSEKEINNKQEKKCSKSSINLETFLDKENLFIDFRPSRRVPGSDPRMTHKVKKKKSKRQGILKNSITKVKKEEEIKEIKEIDEDRKEAEKIELAQIRVSKSSKNVSFGETIFLGNLKIIP